MVARKPKVEPEIKNLPVPWDEELARYAAEGAEAEASASAGTFFSIKGGQLTLGGNPLPNNEVAAIVVDFCFENVFYEGDYDPDEPRGPTCYAFARKEPELEPHERVVAASNHQHERCQGCEHNEFGSAEKGRGKACKNTRRLALIAAGNFDRQGGFVPDGDPAVIASQPIVFLRMPVTSVKGWATTVTQVANVLRRPMWAVYTRIKVVPDPRTQFRVVVELLGKVPDALIPTIKDRVTEAGKVLMNPYPEFVEEEEEAPVPPPPPARGAKAAKATRATEVTPSVRGGKAAAAPPPTPAAGGRRGAKF